MIFLKDELGELVLKKGEPIVVQYQRYLPDTFNAEVIYAILIALAGIVTIWIIEKVAAVKTDS